MFPLNTPWKDKQHLYTIIVLILVVFVDLLTKHLIETNFKLHETKNIIGSFIQLILIYNRGGVFGIVQGATVILFIISIFVLLFIFYTYMKYPHPSKLFRISIGLIVGGALGNMHDRLLNPKGVVDFVYIGWDKFVDFFGMKIFLRWPAFNVADAAILIGAITLAVLFWKNEKKNPA